MKWMDCIALDILLILLGLFIKSGKLNHVLTVTFGKTEEEKRRMDMAYYQNVGLIACIVLAVLIDIFVMI